MDYIVDITQVTVTTNHKKSSKIKKNPLNWKLIVPATEHKPLGRWKHAAVVTEDGCLYVHGGRSGSHALRDLWRLRPTGVYSDDVIQLQESCWEWEEIELSGNVPPALEEHTMTAHGEHLLLFGGCFGYMDCVDAPLWIISLSYGLSRQWQPHGEVCHPETRRGHSALIHKSVMHVFGGYVDLKGSCCQLWSFDLSTESWHLAWSPATHNGPGPAARHGHSAVLHDGAMWVHGGMSDLQQCADTWKWSFRIGQWCRIRVSRGVIPPPMANHAAVVLITSGGTIMLVSGGDIEQQIGLWMFHFHSECWRPIVQSGEQPMRMEHHTMLLLPQPPPNLSLPTLSMVCRQASRASADSAYRSASTSRSGSCRLQQAWVDQSKSITPQISRSRRLSADSGKYEEEFTEELELQDLENQPLACENFVDEDIILPHPRHVAYANRSLSVTSSASLNSIWDEQTLSPVASACKTMQTQMYLVLFGEKENNVCAKPMVLWYAECPSAATSL